MKVRCVDDTPCKMTNIGRLTKGKEYELIIVESLTGLWMVEDNFGDRSSWEPSRFAVLPEGFGATPVEGRLCICSLPQLMGSGCRCGGK